jgi:hypothetical protein
MLRSMENELKDQRVPVLMTASELRRLDAWRRATEDMPSRGEAIRRLVGIGLQHGEDLPRTATKPAGRGAP